jgi:hypothetical protein
MLAASGGDDQSPGRRLCRQVRFIVDLPLYGQSKPVQQIVHRRATTVPEGLFKEPDRFYSGCTGPCYSAWRASRFWPDLSWDRGGRNGRFQCGSQSFYTLQMR